MNVATKNATQSLFDRLGGEEVLQAVVEAFYKRVLADDRIKHFFSSVSKAKLKRMQLQFLSHAFGGDAPYTGRDLNKAHAGLKGLNDEHFDAVVEHLALALETFDVDERLISEVVAVAESVRGDVLATHESSRRNFNQYHSAIEGSATAMMMVDRDLIITYANPATFKLISDNRAVFDEAYHGFDLDGLIGSCIDIFHKSPERQRRLLSDPANLPFQTDIRIGPMTFALNVSAMLDADGNYVGNSLEWGNVTEARNATNEAARIQSAIEGSATCMMMIDRDLIITYANPATMAMMRENLSVFEQAYPGFALDKLIGTCIDTFHARPEHQRALLGDPANLPYEAEISIGPLYFRLNVSAMRDRQGNYIGNTLEWANITTERLAESNINQTIEQVDQRTNELNNASSKMVDLSGNMASQVTEITEETANAAAGAEEMSNTMTSVSVAAEQAAANINSVAVATEQMTNSVAEIANNTERAREVTDNAVKSVENASSRVDELDDAAQEISKVIEAIVEIAEQTKLLALNATIEAARAGEAGKGFAVVANEVKELAKQTREATADIRAKIENMQTSTQGTVGEISNINRVMNDVNEIVAIIATSVNEQNVATKDIASNISQASTGVRDVSSSVTQAAGVSKDIAENLNNVNRGVQAIQDAAMSLNDQIGSVSGASDGLTSMVEDLKRQRTAGEAR